MYERDDHVHEERIHVTALHDLKTKNLDRRCNQHAGGGVGTHGIDLHHLELETDDFKARGGR